MIGLYQTATTITRKVRVSATDSIYDTETEQQIYSNVPCLLYVTNPKQLMQAEGTHASVQNKKCVFSSTINLVENDKITIDSVVYIVLNHRKIRNYLFTEVKEV